MIVRLRQLFDPYIGLMMAVILFAAVLPAQGRGAAIAGGASDAGIVFLFFLYGTRLEPQAVLGGLTQWKLHIAILLSTFVLFPLLGLAIQSAVAPVLPAALATGIVFLSVLPSTVQSSIAFTSIAGGNIPAAICAASASNLLGVFLSPLLAGWLLSTGHVELSFDVFRDILLQLLAPFLAGQLVRPWIAAWIQRHKRILGYVDRGTILLIIYVAFSRGMVEHIWSQLGALEFVIVMACVSGLLALVLVMTGFIGRRVMRLSTPDEIVLQFCGSKKSLASGLPMATVLFSGSELGMIILPLMLFHQLQLIVCAILARHYAAAQA